MPGKENRHMHVHAYADTQCVVTHKKSQRTLKTITHGGEFQKQRVISVVVSTIYLFWL